LRIWDLHTKKLLEELNVDEIDPKRERERSRMVLNIEIRKNKISGIPLKSFPICISEY